MQRLEDKAFRTLSSSASASSASKRLLERGLSKLKAGRAKKRALIIVVNTKMIYLETKTGLYMYPNNIGKK